MKIINLNIFSFIKEIITDESINPKNQKRFQNLVNLFIIKLDTIII
mgnify:CR=1 FL=1